MHAIRNNQPDNELKHKTYQNPDILNTLIIGGGSAGLYLATLLEKANLSYKILESFNKVGGQCITAYPYKYIYDIPGLGAMTGEEYVRKLIHHINSENILTNATYIDHESKEDYWLVNSTHGSYKALNIVFATGMGMGGYQKPKVAKLKLYENKQIFFFPQNKDRYINKKIVVFGGGDSAFDALDMLHTLSSSLTLVHRRSTFTAMKNKEKVLEKVITYTPYNLVCLNGSEESLKSVTIEKDKVQITLEVDYIFFCYGYNTTGNLKFNVNMTDMRCYDESNDNINGVFAIGAASNYPLKRDLITTGLWEARVVFSHLKKLSNIDPSHN